MNNNYPYNSNPYMPYQNNNGMTNYGQRPYQQNLNPYSNNQPMYSNVQPTVSNVQTENIPIVDIRFVSTEEAKGFIMFPNTAVLLIDKPNNIAYLKVANGNAQSTMRPFKFQEINNNGEPLKDETPKLNMAEYVKIEDLKSMGFITNAQYQESQKLLIENLNAKLKELQSKISGS